MVGEVLVGDDVVVGELRVVSVGDEVLVGEDVVVGELRLVPPLPPPVGEEVPPPPSLAYATAAPKKTRALTINMSETTKANRRQRHTIFWR